MSAYRYAPVRQNLNDYYDDEVVSNEGSSVGSRSRPVRQYQRALSPTGAEDDSTYTDSYADAATAEVPKYPAYKRPPNKYYDGEDEKFSVLSETIVQDTDIVGMHPQLADFMRKHDVVLDDGAVVNVKAQAVQDALANREAKKFVPPCSLSMRDFVILTALSTLGATLLVAGIVAGIVHGNSSSTQPVFPSSGQWWDRSQAYQVNVRTWANDVGGPVGRLEDVAPRMAYLNDQHAFSTYTHIPHKIGADTQVLTNFLASDPNGVTDWMSVDQNVADPSEAMTRMLPDLVEQANKNSIKLLHGMPLYATSDQHAWFKDSVASPGGQFGNFYQWNATAPTTDQEKRRRAFDRTRKSYYTHMHGNPKSPMLNLTNTDVQQKLDEVLQFWQKKLNLYGVMVTNSSNVQPSMRSGLSTILNKATGNNSIWFADDPETDAKFNKDVPVRLFDIDINARQPTRADDLGNQLTQKLADTRNCSPIWRVKQLTTDMKDFRTVLQLARFLPGMFLMEAGQEVDLTTGLTDLLDWKYTDSNQYATYWPVNANLGDTGRQLVADWKDYWTKISQVTLLNTPAASNKIEVVESVKTGDNLLTCYRQPDGQDSRAFFVTSFQTLNTDINFNSIFANISQQPQCALPYNSKGATFDRKTVDTMNVVNNQVLMLDCYS